MGTLYDVFARKAHPEPLRQIGSVELEGTTDIVEAVLEKFGPESEWLEMLTVPHQALILVFPEEKELSQ